MDKETVIKGLENLKETIRTATQYTFTSGNICAMNMARIDNAIAALKEQEAKTGHWVSIKDGDVVAIDNDGFPERACFCSECKTYLIASDEYAVYGRFCPYCGSKMEGRR